MDAETRKRLKDYFWVVRRESERIAQSPKKSAKQESKLNLITGETVQWITDLIKGGGARVIYT